MTAHTFLRIAAHARHRPTTRKIHVVRPFEANLKRQVAIQVLPASDEIRSSPASDDHVSDRGLRADRGRISRKLADRRRRTVFSHTTGMGEVYRVTDTVTCLCTSETRSCRSLSS